MVHRNDVQRRKTSCLVCGPVVDADDGGIIGKHILGQTLFQMGIIFAFVFGAPAFVPEYWDEEAYGANDGTPVIDKFDADHDYWT